MACLSSNGILAPAGITAASGSGAFPGAAPSLGVTAAGAGVAGTVACEAPDCGAAGCAGSAACPKAIPETRQRIKIHRIANLPEALPRCILSEPYPGDHMP